MNRTQLAGLILIVGGILAIVYGGFSYTKETHAANIGSVHFELKERERVNIPLWAGVCAIAGGVVVLTLRRRT
jgi:drug/metabolite transporter (DMT)-like permease